MRRALGKGLEAFFPETPAKPPSNPIEEGLIPLEQIRPSRSQPRRCMDEDALAGLADSIRENGLIQPLVVMRTEDGYDLIAGERRWRAARKAGLESVPAVVREATDAQKFQMALVENIQREDLSPLEEAEAYHRMTKEFDLTQEQVATRVGKRRATVANMLRLLSLPDEVKDKVAAGTLTMGHARALLAAPAARQIDLSRDVVKRGLSVRETERLAAVPAYKSRSKVVSIDVHARAVEEELCRLMGTRVRLAGRGRGGVIEIHYHSAEALERILELMRGQEPRESNAL